MGAALKRLRATKYSEVLIDGVWWRLRRAHGRHLEDLTALRMAVIRPSSDLLLGTVDQGALDIEDATERRAATEAALLRRFVENLLEDPQAIEALNAQNAKTAVVARACVVAFRLDGVDNEGITHAWEDCTLVAEEADEDDDTGRVWWASLTPAMQGGLSAAAMAHSLGEGVRQQAESFPGGSGADGDR